MYVHLIDGTYELYRQHFGQVTKYGTPSFFRIIKRPLLDNFAKTFPTYYLGDTFEALVVAGKAGYNVGQIPTPLLDRQAGSPSSTKSDSIRQIAKILFITLFGLHSKIPKNSVHS